MLTRRQFIASLGAAGASGVAWCSYAFGAEPLLRLTVTHYQFLPPGWPPGLHLRIAVIADLHACRPWMTLERIRQIVARTNALDPDLTVLLGDYAAAHPFVTGRIAAADWAGELAGLKAHLGVHAILGNHDWWDDEDAQRTGRGPVEGRRALEAAGIPVYENDVVRLAKRGGTFWLAGLGDQLAFKPSAPKERDDYVGVDDLEGTLAKVRDDAPVILLAHEPDIFPQVPDRVSLTLSGHTHGGQVRLFGYSPVVPSRFGNRYAYGHVAEQHAGGTRHLIISGGLGCSIAPIRFGVPPEILLVELGYDTASYPS